MSPSNREQWFAEMLRAGLDTRILSEPDILAHATPAVLIGSLPKEVVVRLLDATLSSGTMSPQAVVQTATPDLLAAHVPQPVIWDCLATAAQRAGFAGDGVPDAPGSREFLRRALEHALTLGIATPKDVVEDVNATVIGHNFPDALTTKLLEASLAAGKMNAELIVETLGVEAITKHAPTHVVWAVLARTGASPAGTPRAAPAAEPKQEGKQEAKQEPKLDFLEEDVASVLVELDDSSGTMEVSRDKEDPALAPVAGTLDDKKKSVTKHTTKRA